MFLFSYSSFEMKNFTQGFLIMGSARVCCCVCLEDFSVACVIMASRIVFQETRSSRKPICVALSGRMTSSGQCGINRRHSLQYSWSFCKVNVLFSMSWFCTNLLIISFSENKANSSSIAKYCSSSRIYYNHGELQRL